MRITNSILILVAVLLISCIPVSAQESELVVVDEVIAQINDSVITLSQIRSEMKSAVDGLVQQGKSESEAKAMVDGKMGQLIANLITEELLLQRGKEMGVEKAVEARINQQFLERMREFDLKSLDDLYEAMRQQGFDPEDIRNEWRRRFTQDEVWRNQVDSVVYWQSTSKEIKEYYNKNAERFKKPATVTISEIFLSFAGRDKDAVIEKAKEITARLRGGADFEQVAIESSDRPNVSETKGKAGTFAVTELDPMFAKPIERVKVGGYTDPIEMDIGMEIIRVDERTEGSDEAHFNEAAVRNAILQEKLPEARKKYVEELKDDAYIKIRESYRAMVLPHLNPEDKKTAEVSK